jgi:hypothetical protein
MARPPITRANPYTPKRGSLAGRTFNSERQYRNALAHLKGFASWEAERRSPKSIHSATALDLLRPSARQARARALRALSYMRRDGFSLAHASRRAGTTPETVIRYTGQELERRGSGRFIAKTGDRLFARMPALTTEGPRELDVRGYRQRSLVGRHGNAVKHYGLTGEVEQFKAFEGKNGRVGGFQLETDPDAIDYWAPREPFSFEEIYDVSR